MGKNKTKIYLEARNPGLEQNEATEARLATLKRSDTTDSIALTGEVAVIPPPKKKSHTAHFKSYSNTASLRSLHLLLVLDLDAGSGIHLVPHPTHDHFRECALAILRQLWAVSLLVHPCQAVR